MQARDPRRGWRIMASNSLARQSRIVPGMPVSEAMAIKPDLRLLEYDPQEDLAALVELAQEAWQFSPMVGLEGLDAQLWAGRFLHQPQAFFLDATGLTKLLGGPTAMLRQILGWLAGKGYIAYAAMAPSLGAAWALANYAYRSQAETQLLRQAQAELKSSVMMEKPTATTMVEGNDLPSGVVVESVAELPDAVDPLPINALRIDGKTHHLLRQLAIRSIGELALLPRAGLANRFGEQLVHRLDEVRQGKATPIVCLKEPATYTVETSLEIPTIQRATIEEIMRRLVHELCQRLKNQGEGALRLVACLRPEQGVTHLVSLGLYRATCNERHLCSLILGQLERQVFQHAAKTVQPLVAVRLMATMAAPLVWKQQELFNTESQRHREPLAHLIDLLAGRLGRRSVVAARLQRHPQPELVCQWRPLTGLRSDGQSQNTSRKLAKSPAKREATSLDEAAIGSQGQPRVGHWLAPSSYDHFRRPTQLYPSPQPLPIQTVDREGLPEHIDFQGDRHTIIQSWGPERIESGWWAGAHHRRDYYRVATDRGAWLWIYRELQQKRWFLHGVF